MAGPLDNSCAVDTVACWELGEGQGSLSIIRIVEDPHPPLPASTLDTDRTLWLEGSAGGPHNKA